QVLLISHEATRTGAPLCLLRLAQELVQNRDLSCWIVLDRGGELAGAFARVAPPGSGQDPVQQGPSRGQAPARVAPLLPAYAATGLPRSSANTPAPASRSATPHLWELTMLPARPTAFPSWPGCTNYPRQSTATV